MIWKCELASRKDPWWWVTDRAGYKLLMPLAIHRTTSPRPEDAGLIIWSLIVGPVCLRVAYRTSNASLDRPAASAGTVEGVVMPLDHP